MRRHLHAAHVHIGTADDLAGQHLGLDVLGNAQLAVGMLLTQVAFIQVLEVAVVAVQDEPQQGETCQHHQDEVAAHPREFGIDLVVVAHLNDLPVGFTPHEGIIDVGLGTVIAVCEGDHLAMTAGAARSLNGAVVDQADHGIHIFPLGMGGVGLRHQAAVLG